MSAATNQPTNMAQPANKPARRGLRDITNQGATSSALGKPVAKKAASSKLPPASSSTAARPSSASSAPTASSTSSYGKREADDIDCRDR